MVLCQVCLKVYKIGCWCQKTRHINRYSELIGGYRILDENHIANGDVDFDGVNKLEPHEKNNKI